MSSCASVAIFCPPFAPVDSFCAKAIRYTNTVNYDTNSSIKRYLVTLVASIALPIIAALDLGKYLVLQFYKLYKLEQWFTIGRILCVAAQTPFVIFANIFGANWLPTATDPIDQELLFQDDHGTWSTPCRETRMKYILTIQKTLDGYIKGKATVTIDDLVQLRNDKYWITIDVNHLSKKDHLAMDLALHRDYEPFVKLALGNRTACPANPSLSGLTKRAFMEQLTNFHGFLSPSPTFTEGSITRKANTIIFILEQLDTKLDEDIKTHLLTLRDSFTGFNSCVPFFFTCVLCGYACLTENYSIINESLEQHSKMSSAQSIVDKSQLYKYTREVLEIQKQTIELRKKAIRQSLPQFTVSKAKGVFDIITAYSCLNPMPLEKVDAKSPAVT